MAAATSLNALPIAGSGSSFVSLPWVFVTRARQVQQLRLQQNGSRLLSYSRSSPRRHLIALPPLDIVCSRHLPPLHFSLVCFAPAHYSPSQFFSRRPVSSRARCPRQEWQRAATGHGCERCGNFTKRMCIRVEREKCLCRQIKSSIYSTVCHQQATQKQKGTLPAAE